jgi:hypothetical protein
LSRKSGSIALRVISTVSGTVARTASTPASMPAAGIGSAGFTVRSTENTTASASNGTPLWKATPSRNSKV